VRDSPASDDVVCNSKRLAMAKGSVGPQGNHRVDLCSSTGGLLQKPPAAAALQHGRTTGVASVSVSFWRDSSSLSNFTSGGG
jgi:hypothetical protein